MIFILIIMEHIENIYNPNIIIDIKKSNLEIGQIKYPIIFLFQLITYINYFSDYNLSIILRLFLKNHTNIALSINLKKLFKIELELTNKIISLNVLNDFYKIIYKKMSLIVILNKWYLVYNNDKFWKLLLNEQIDYLQNLKLHFLSIFDCSKGGIPYYQKIAPLLKQSKSLRHELLENVKERLIQIFKLFGYKIFQSMDIPIISVNDFYELSDENLIKYLIVIHEKIKELLIQIIKLFDSYNLSCIQLTNLINPINIKINTQQIDSETELEDIKLYCN